MAEPLIYCDVPASELTAEQLVELRKWWDAFGCAKTPAAVLHMVNETLALRAAAKEWITHFERLSRDDEPGDRLAAVRNQFHAKRLQMTRDALAMGERTNAEDDAR